MNNALALTNMILFTFDPLFIGNVIVEFGTGFFNKQLKTYQSLRIVLYSLLYLGLQFLVL